LILEAYIQIGGSMNSDAVQKEGSDIYFSMTRTTLIQLLY